MSEDAIYTATFVLDDFESWWLEVMERTDKLSKADLSHANLSGADLSGANLSGADVAGAVSRT